MTTIYNRLSTREEEGQYKHMMGLRSHMVDPGNVHEIAERANMAFGVGSVPVWVPTTTTGLSNSSTAEWPTTDPRGEFFMPTNSKGQPESTVHFRQDTGEILAFHRGTYKLRPEGYGKIFEHAHSLFGETCVAVIGLDNGCRMYALFQPDEPVDFGSGVLIPTVGFAASLDSSIATSVHAFAYDPWCTNAFTGYSTVTNTKATVNHDAIFAERFEVLASTVNRTRALANVAKIASDQEFTDTQFNELVSSLSLVKEKELKARPVFDPQSGEWKEPHAKSKKAFDWTVGSLLQTWADERQRLGRNKWGAYNAVQGCEQHQLNRGRSGSDGKRNRRALRAALVDDHHKLADEAWVELGFDNLVTV